MDVVEQQRQGAENGQDEPDQGDQQKAIPDVKVAPLFLARDKPDQQPAQKSDIDGCPEMFAGTIVQNQRTDQREKHQQAENGDDNSQRIDDGKSAAAYKGWHQKNPNPT